MYKKNALLSSTILLGCVLPFGNILGPLLFRAEEPDLLENKRFIIRFQILWTILFFITGILIWLYQIQMLKSGLEINNIWLRYWVIMYFAFVFIYPIMNIVFIIFKKSDTLLLYPRIGKKK